MSGLSAARSQIRHLGKKSVVIQRGRKVSVVYFDENGEIDWPLNCNGGVLAVPKALSLEEWERKYGHVD